MKIIKWSFITNSGWGVDHPKCVEPLISSNFNSFSNLSKEITQTRKGTMFLKCPAYTDFIKNTFVFHAPFDLTIDIEVDNGTGDIKIFCENISQEVFNSIIDTRYLMDRNRGISPYPLVGIDWLAVFQTEEPTMMQLLPASMHYNDFTNKTSIIPGEFDISKWTRPVEIVFELRKFKERIEIKKGDAIAYYKFHSPDFIKLEFVETPWDEIKTCNDIRDKDMFRPLKERYSELAKERAKLCPHLQNNE